MNGCYCFAKDLMLYTNMRLCRWAIYTDGSPSNKTLSLILYKFHQTNSLLYTVAYKTSILCESHGSQCLLCKITICVHLATIYNLSSTLSYIKMVA